MKRHNLMVGKIIRKKYRKKVSKKPKIPQSKSVYSFNSLERRGPLMPVDDAKIYEKWTQNIRKSMEKAKMWPHGTDEWTQELVGEYVRRLQSEFWRSARVRKEKILQREGNALYPFPRGMKTDRRMLIRVFDFIFKKKLRPQVRRLKICDLDRLYYVRTIFRTATCNFGTLDCYPPKGIQVIVFEKFY